MHTAQGIERAIRILVGRESASITIVEVMGSRIPEARRPPAEERIVAAS
jgi:hypothetical protein